MINKLKTKRKGYWFNGNKNYSIKILREYTLLNKRSLGAELIIPIFGIKHRVNYWDAFGLSIPVVDLGEEDVQKLYSFRT